MILVPNWRRGSWIVLVLSLLAAAPGCTASRLRSHTTHQGKTLPELQYEQVLDNLAQFSVNPAALPWHLTLHEGTTQITDSISGGGLVNLDDSSLEPQLFGSRTAVAQWGMAPVVEPTALRLLRFAYQRAQGLDRMPPPEFLDDLAHEIKGQIAENADLQQETGAFLAAHYRPRSSEPEPFDTEVITTNDEDFYTRPRDRLHRRSPLARDASRQVDAIVREIAAIRPGWYHTGCRRDVPRDAIYVGRSGSRYAWVNPDGLNDLTEFTLTILKLASIVKETQTLINSGSVKFSPGDRGGG